MRWVGASICVPLMIKSNLVGFIILGAKKNNTLYNDEDKKFLSHVSERISEAITKIMVEGPGVVSPKMESQPLHQSS